MGGGVCKARGWRRNVRTRTWDINIDVVCSFETGHLGVGLLCAFFELLYVCAFCEIIKV